MKIKKLLNDPITKVVRRAFAMAELGGRDRDTDIVLAWALQKVGSSKKLLCPVDYVKLLKDCIIKKRIKIQEIKTDSGASSDNSAKRFSLLVNALGNLHPIEFSIAEEIALIADSYRGNMKSIESDWASDVRSDFDVSSSFGTTGRILTMVVHFTQSKKCLELGTAFGMSSLFILEALKTRGTDIHLTTLEGSEPQFSLSSKILRTRYGNQVSCEFGWTQEALPRIVKSLEPLDFMFHDAGHSRISYVMDFHTVLPILKPGAVVLIDDIRWDDPRFFKGNARCYEGWMEVVKHHRVRRAVEIDDAMGLLLLGG
jgi:predicted O-methyltransferase YrrM